MEQMKGGRPLQAFEAREWHKGTKFKQNDNISNFCLFSLKAGLLSFHSRSDFFSASRLSSQFQS